jgi:hypothetical protein
LNTNLIMINSSDMLKDLWRFGIGQYFSNCKIMLQSIKNKIKVISQTRAELVFSINIHLNFWLISFSLDQTFHAFYYQHKG